MIVVIGGASTAGTSPDSAYPFFLEAALRQRHPGEDITVINKGIPGQTTEQMAARFPKDVYPIKPNLVIWETGTVDAVRGEDVDAMAQAVTDGLVDIENHGAEAMLVDMQYNPSTVSVINFETLPGRPPPVGGPAKCVYVQALRLDEVLDRRRRVRLHQSAERKKTIAGEGVLRVSRRKVGGRRRVRRTLK